LFIIFQQKSKAHLKTPFGVGYSASRQVCVCNSEPKA
jgi:hypothetical protein